MIRIEEIKSPRTPRLNVMNSNESGTIKLNSGSRNEKKSVNFGPGIEMLMNPKRTNATSPVHADINLSDLSKLDADLMGTTPTLNRRDARKKIFEISSSQKPSSLKNPMQSNIRLNISELPPKISLGKSVQDPKKNVTWDGFKKFNEITCL